MQRTEFGFLLKQIIFFCVLKIFVKIFSKNSWDGPKCSIKKDEMCKNKHLHLQYAKIIPNKIGSVGSEFNEMHSCI